MNNFIKQINKRCTFAIISHPDAGKTTLTEKFLLFGGAIQLAGTVKARKAARHATSDWMELEKQRGISVTTSVMQFPYKNRIFNLIDTPGHADFSEDTYRTLTAVDSALMVIDGAKGVESRTIKLLDICRLRTTPISTFINKMDRNCKEPIELLDEIEDVLKIKVCPITWPIGMGSAFKGIYHLYDDEVIFYKPSTKKTAIEKETIAGLTNTKLDELLGPQATELREEIELIKGAGYEFNHEDYINGNLTPIYFGSAVNNFGIQELLEGINKNAPSPLPRKTKQRIVEPNEEKLTGFVFKIQANMDPAHHDRVAFLRICSGSYKTGMQIHHVRLNRNIKVPQALTFMAGEREHTQEAFPGDIIGIHNYGSIQIGDTFTQGENIQFIGIPNFAPELFRLVRLKDPLKPKALKKGLLQLSEEGAAQVFRPLNSNALILGAIGILQFDVVAYRLRTEYNADCVYESVNITTMRWIKCDDQKMLEEFKNRESNYLALDNSDYLTYLAPTKINLKLAIERWPEIAFLETREH